MTAKKTFNEIALRLHPEVSDYGEGNEKPDKKLPYFLLEQKPGQEIKVIDIIGNTVYTESIVAHEGENLTEVDLTKTANGIYFLILEREGEEAKTMRITIQ